jgi:hypothetical protein
VCERGEVRGNLGCHNSKLAGGAGVAPFRATS